MISKNKNIINYIQKYASPPPKGRDGKPVNQPARLPINKSPKAGVAPVKLNAIGKMQGQIIALAQSISSSTKDFNDFMVEAYSNESYIKGEEWDPGQKYHTKQTRLASPLIRLDNVVDQLKKIGSPQNPIKEDGNWDERTQNALKNVWAFADALVRVYEDFGSTFTNPQFTKADLQALGDLIPKTPVDRPEEVRDLNAKDKDEKAKLITPLLDRLTDFYRSFSKKILDNPIYRPFIKPVSPPGVSPDMVPEGSKIYNKFDINLSPSRTPGLAPSAKDLVGKVLNNIRLTNINNVKVLVNVPLAALRDQRSLQKFMIDELLYSDEEVMKRDYQIKVLDEISKQL